MVRNGFENAVVSNSRGGNSGASNAEPKTQSTGSGLGPPLSTVVPPILGVAPTIAISSPLAGAALARVQVQGTFTGPANTGITVLGVAATVIGNQFVSEPQQLAPGSTEITVRAKTLDGLVAAQTLSNPNAESVVAIMMLLLQMLLIGDAFYSTNEQT